MPSWLGIFKLGTFSRVALNDLRYISLLGLSSSSCCCFLSIRLFCYDLSVPIFSFKFVLLPFHPVAKSSCIFPLLAGRFFHCLGISRFVWIVWSCLNIFLVFLISPVPSGLFPRVVSFVLIVLFFAFRFNIFPYFPLFYIFTCCRRFLICFCSLISHPGVGFLFVFLREHRFYHRLISLLHRLVSFIPW